MTTSQVLTWFSLKYRVSIRVIDDGRGGGEVGLVHLKKLSVLMLCTPVFIFTSGSSALLGHPRCGLSI